MYSAADIKHRKPVKIREPHPGGPTRTIYDILVANRFEPVPISHLLKIAGSHDKLGRVLCYLRDQYDMELARVHRKVIFGGFRGLDGRGR